MKIIILATALFLATCGTSFADDLPPYVQVQVNNLNQEISQLQAQRDALVKQKESLQGSENDQNVSIAKEQLQAQIDRLNSQIQFVQQQIESLQKGS